MNTITVLRAEEEWQRAGAYMVRIHGLNREHHISLQEEIDDHDGEGTRYIVLLDDGYPFGTCRFYELDPVTVSIGRVVVLADYRGQEYGKKTIKEAETWIRELGYREILVDSRTVAVGFYQKLGYSVLDEEVYQSGPFECVCMGKTLD